MAQRPNPPKGMRDLHPTEVRLRRHLTDRILKAFEGYGYEQVETPALEDLTRLIGSEGGDNEKLIFKTLRRGLDLAVGFTDEASITDLGLRYDLTVPLARYFASNSANTLLPLKAIQVGPVWRAERPQKGRYRQFVQCDIDNIGDGSTAAEIELLAGGVEALRAAGVDDFVVRINDRRLLNAIVNWAGYPEQSAPAVLIEMDKLDKVGVDGVAQGLAKIGAGPTADAKLVQLLNDLTSASNTKEKLAVLPEGGKQAVDDLVAISIGVNKALAKPVAFDIDPTVVRGQGYYTGTIFEVHHPASSGTLAAGGRYDRMIGKLSGIETPACGFSIGFERLFDIVSASAQPNERRLVVLHDGGHAEAANAEARKYRDAGLPVRVDVVAKNRTAQLSRFADAGYTEWIDLSSGSLEPRPLANSRNEKDAR